MPKAGFVALVGKPNAGKSTLLNRLVGETLAITSPKPQSTRDRVVGIRTDDDRQFVFLDTPGLLDPEYALHAVMRGVAIAALREADVVVHLADVADGPPPPLATLVPEVGHPLRAPVLRVLNKGDTLTRQQREALALSVDHVVSAKSGAGIEGLLRGIADRLPDHPFLYPPDELSTQSLRFFAAELIRETALEQLDEEVPYSVACVVEEFREDRSPTYIRVTLHVERDSQKGILLGAGGQRIKALSTAARLKLERLTGGPVFLDIWVKVTPNWRRSPDAMARFGYRAPESDA
ncbi:MAG: GTPase Era [Gemmatimonadota bacterium]